MTHKRRILRWGLAGLALLGVAFVLGPRARLRQTAVTPVRPEVDLADWVARREAEVPGIRPGDQKAVEWADTAVPSNTPLAVVYLHGFSADRHEIAPVAEEVARALGANLFLTRLRGHGRDGGAMAEATAEDWLQDTEEALTVGGRLGTRLVVIGTSTGGTLALWAAAQERWRDRLAAVVLISPNLGPRDGSADMLLWPWGGLLARLAVGEERCFEPLNAGQERHWTTCYPTSALLPMMALVDHVRRMDPAEIRAPVLVLYSPEDQVVDAQATEALFPRLGSDRKEMVAVEGSDDPAHHVLAGDIVSPSTTESTVLRIVEFVRRVAPTSDMP